MIKVAIAIIEKDGKILIAKRTRDDPFRGKWEFPGGKVKAGETAEGCVKREVLEELGIVVHIDKFLCSSTYEYNHTSVELLAYKAYHVTGELLQKEYREMKWVTPQNLDTYDFPEANQPIIEKIMNKSMTA